MTSSQLGVSSDSANAVARRYSDAYIVARTVNGFGDSVKALGIAVGVVLGFLAFAAGTKGGFGFVVALFGGALAVCVATVLYLLGTLIAANAQVLKATLDTAVNSSPFLTNVERARVMSLPMLSPSNVLASTAGNWTCSCGHSNDRAYQSCINCGVDRTAA